MLPVEIVPLDGKTLVLRARGSELLILPQHVGALRSLKTPKEFTGYFLHNALINRPARKLFEAWLRKDTSLWQRIYNTVQKEMTVEPEAPESIGKKEPVTGEAGGTTKSATPKSEDKATTKKAATETKEAAAKKPKKDIKKPVSGSKPPVKDKKVAPKSNMKKAPVQAKKRS